MCCDHDGDRVSLKDLNEDITSLINSPTMMQDRADMVAGKELPHCNNCQRNITENPAIGGTLYENYNTNPKSQKLKSMGIMLNTTCLYTCVYCSSHFSSSWYSDSEKNGLYQLHDTQAHTLSMMDKVQNKISIVDVSQSQYYTEFNKLMESNVTSELSTLRIGGGEPLLYENLIGFIAKTHRQKPNLNMEIYTGLGVSEKMFANFLKDITQFKHVIKIVLSQEGAGAQAELMRYGTDWTKWETMASQLILEGFHVEFNSVLNIISLFTIENFLNWKRQSVFKDSIVRVQPLVGPEYMSLKTLDQELYKELLNKLLAISRNELDDTSIDAVKYIPNYKNNERENLKMYLDEFIKRRNLDTTVLPQAFWNWLNG